MDALTAAVQGLAASPWVLLVLLACCVLDSLVPPVPSEALVLGLAAVGATGHGPHPALVAVVAAFGALAGDSTAYALGRRLPHGRLPFVRRDRAERALAAVRAQLELRGVTVVLTARWVPVGRIAVTVGAGLVGYPARRFLPAAALASALWAAWTVLLGLGTGTLLTDQPLLAVGAGVAVGLLVGLGVDVAARHTAGVRGRSRATAQPTRTMRWSAAPRTGPASSSGSSSLAACASAASSTASSPGSSP